MKKLVLAVLATTAAAQSATAGISTGFYLGAHLGWGNAKSKLTSTVAGVATPGRTDMGNDAGNIGIHGGYGFLSGCWYFAGELFYTWENMKMHNSLGSANSRAELKRNGYYGIALRAGYVFFQNTLFYIRLGGHMGKWKITNNGFANVFTTANPGTGSKNRFSFAPGVGLETAVHRNVYLRGEWFYEWGPNVTATNANVAGTNFVRAGNVRYNSFRLGLTYKF